MRSKLQKFAEFANCLLPHEAEYLLLAQRFEDVERVQLLKEVAANCKKISGFEPYNEAIDKRKYSSLKSWIEERLEAIDVDKEYAWLSATETAVITDSIKQEDEKRLLRLFQSSDPTAYNFLKLYDLGRIYRHYLHVRMRYDEHKTVVRFLEKHRTSYEYARLVNDKLHQATEDIIAQYTTNNAESMRWEYWLSSVFYEQSLDGYNRTLAYIRLIFIAYNYRRFDLLPDKFDHLEQLIQGGRFYSRRILLNFYSQRLLMYARQNDLDQAVYYGYLSIRAENNDYLYYVNNLAAVLLRQHKPTDALTVLRNAVGVAKVAHNFHNKIGHSAYICLSFNQLKQYKQADTHARTFFDAYRKEVFNHRWHLFFSAWLEALMGLGQYAQILKMASTHQLRERDEAYRKSPNYNPSVPWLLALAMYRSGKITFRQISDQFHTDLDLILTHNGHTFPASLNMLLALIHQTAPDVLNEVKGMMQKKGIIIRF